jgi:hypothetical protein
MSTTDDADANAIEVPGVGDSGSIKVERVADGGSVQITVAGSATLDPRGADDLVHAVLELLS